MFGKRRRWQTPSLSEIDFLAYKMENENGTTRQLALIFMLKIFYEEPFLSSRSFHLRLPFFSYLNPELGDHRLSTFFVRIAFLCCFIAGMLCCARYSEDDLWYRAQVKSVERQNPLEVRVVYVDYGTTEVVNADR